MGCSVNLTRSRTKVMELADEMPYFPYWSDAKGGAYTFLGEEVGDIYGNKPCSRRQVFTLLRLPIA